MRRAGDTVECDYLVVGGGSAGCVLAARLSEDRSARVLLIERGGRYSHLALGVPLLAMRHLGTRLREHRTVPQPGCADRVLPLPVAEVLGGGSSVNAMIYLRGDRLAYERWAELGAEGWDHAGVLPFFRRFEDHEAGATRHHGADGPIAVSRGRYRSAVGEAFVEACGQLGLKRNEDFCAGLQRGAGFYHYTQRDGARSGAVAYLRRARGRDELAVLPHTEVDEIVLEGRRAVGVRCRGPAGLRTVRARREVILAAGALGTPRLLLLSGIGPADELRPLGLTLRCHLPGVGRGLQDHPQCPVLFRQREPVPLAPSALLGPFLRWCVAGDGPFSSAMLAAGAFLELGGRDGFSDCQLTARWAASPPHRDAADLQVAAVDVESRGSLRLLSADPRRAPAVDPGYLSAQRDVAVLVAGIRFARALAHTPAFRDLGLGEEIAPGPGVESDQELARYARTRVQTAYHPAGSCPIGDGEHAVVDARLRVRGLEGLRIADASVMPRIVNANTNGPTLMIAEKAADLIRRGQGA